MRTRLRYTYDRQYDKALGYLLKLRRSNVFELIRKARLIVASRSRLACPALIFVAGVLNA